MVRVETVLDSWRTIREDTAQSVEDFADFDFSFKPVDELMSFGEIAAHILTAGHNLTGLLLEGVDNFQTPPFRERLKDRPSVLPQDPSPATLASALRSLGETRYAELSRQTPEFFAGMITRFDGARLTRLEMLQFIKEHELTHRAQLFFYLRLKGIVPATTRRRMAKK
jgi:uncharacterized damage-inducible protein DinB